MFKVLSDAFKDKGVRRKIWFTLIILLIYRIGAYIPLPAVNLDIFKPADGDQGFLGILSSISGGALKNGSILALGVSPYINASIIIQLLTFVIPSWQALSKQGDEGRKKIGLYTRIAALIMGIAQAIGIVISFSNQYTGEGEAFYSLWNGAPAWLSMIVVILILIGGGMFTLWLGEKITEKGVGNGLSLILFVGILSTAGTSIFSTIQSAVTGNIDGIWNVVVFLAAVVIIFGLIIFVDLGIRKVPVQYANQVRGRKMYGGQSTHIPIKVNASGVMPIIFTMAIVSFPQIVMSMFWSDSGAYKWYTANMGIGSWAYIVVTSLLILAFSYFYNQLMFNPEDVSRQIQQNGGFIPGIRPGKPTTEYLKKVSRRMTFFGALFLAGLSLIPTLVFAAIAKGTGGGGTLVNAFSATGLLIIVNVALELHKQLEAQLQMKNYRGFLK